MAIDFMKDLNEAQQAAVRYTDGPSLVIAGAGSGKTRVLTYKIAYLLEQGMAPWNILALTFTNKAAREMKQRIAALVGEERAAYLMMGTFHSVFARILRSEAEHVGFTSNFTIYDESDSRSMIKSIIKDMKLNDKVYKPSNACHRISMAKNHLISPRDYAMNSSLMARDASAYMPEMHAVYTTYCARCKKANAMDFDDLLTYTYALFRDNDDIRRKYAERFRFVLVDEYQDTNRAQQQIVEQLTKESQRICVVGDDAQSIYGFRGANIDNMLDFNRIYPTVKLFKLECNYRSTQRIVEAANSLISHNKRQIPKTVYSHNDEGGKICFKPTYSDKEEALVVCHDIQRMKRKEHADYDSFAILYRTNAQSRPFEEAMRKAGIPYRIYGGLSFYQRKEIKDIIAYFRTVVNPDDEEALKRIIRYPARGIGDTTISKLAATAMEHGVSLWAVFSRPEEYGLNVSRATIKKLSDFRALLQPFIERAPAADAYEIGRDIIRECGIYADLYSEKTPEAIARQENLEEFLGGMHDFVESRREEGRENYVSLTDFLQEVSLLSDLDSEGDEEQKRVSLMTVHSAKGLEFPIVFIVGLEENIFPSPMSVNSMRELEEERRLLYVAITRAERYCTLTCAKNRFRYGRMEFDTPSRFIRDIDPGLLDTDEDKDNVFGLRRNDSDTADVRRPTYRPEREAVGMRQPTTYRRLSPELLSVTPTSAPSSPSAAVSRGDIIEHERFGIGEIISVEGTGDSTKARVRFRNAGEKQLLMKFARFKKVNGELCD